MIFVAQNVTVLLDCQAVRCCRWTGLKGNNLQCKYRLPLKKQVCDLSGLHTGCSLSGVTCCFQRGCCIWDICWTWRLLNLVNRCSAGLQG
ncbi:hypothetical protein chiPu_0005400 [Chiloscyllium punctatum]|uniref:Uncharacterized protein n=1 Tax=Chiloscyllium punctatum TaxID=137246 RepID=A0A401S9A6_CHIPU|nr:hypothetical protein [Chiloscyllium punctatum]